MHHKKWGEVALKTHTPESILSNEYSWTYRGDFMCHLRRTEFLPCSSPSITELKELRETSNSLKLITFLHNFETIYILTVSLEENVAWEFGQGKVLRNKIYLLRTERMEGDLTCIISCYEIVFQLWVHSSDVEPLYIDSTHTLFYRTQPHCHILLRWTWKM